MCVCLCECVCVCVCVYVCVCVCVCFEILLGRGGECVTGGESKVRSEFVRRTFVCGGHERAYIRVRNRRGDSLDV